MAREALTVIGTVIGAWVGAPQLGYALGSMVGNAVDPQVVKAPSIGDVATQTSVEGIPCPLYAGTAGGAGNLIYKGPVRRVRVQEGGKGGEPVVSVERLYCTFAIRIGASLLDGPGVRNGLLSLIKIWENEKLVYDVSPESQILADSIEYAERFAWYPGDETQLPDPSIEAIKGVGEAPAYRGRSYFVGINWDVTDMRGAVPQFRFEVTTAGGSTLAPTVPLVEYADFTQSGATAARMIVKEVDFALAGYMALTTEETGDWPVYTRLMTQTSYGGVTLAESGWIGDPLDETDLDASLDATTEIEYQYADGSTFIDTSPITVRQFVNAISTSIVGPGPFTQGVTPPHGITDGRLQIIRPQFATGTVGSHVSVQKPDPTEVDEPYVALPSGAIVGQTTGRTWLTPEAPPLYVESAGTVDLADVILAASRRCKVPDAKWDLDAITGGEGGSIPVRGVVIASQGYTAQNFINSLRWPFLLDAADYDGQIHITRRGGGEVATITLDDQIEADDGETTEQLRVGDDRRDSPIRRPLKLNLMFPNRTVGYQLTKATSPNYGDREDAVSEVTLEIPVVFDDETEAPQLADILEKVARADAEGEIVRLVHEGAGAKLAPCNVVLLSEPNLTRRCRIESIRDGGTRRRLVMRVDRQHAYRSQLSSQPVPTPPLPPSSLPGPTALAVMNAPGVVDGQDFLGVTVALGAPLAGWTGATLEYSSDDGASWTVIGNFTTRAVMGTLTAELPYASRYCLDVENPLAVQLFRPDDELDSLSFLQMLQERNGAYLVKADGTTEIVQFQYAFDDGDGAWHMTPLVRGRLNTTPATHPAGTQFVLASTAIMVPLPTSLMNRELLFRATSIGMSPETSPQVPFLWQPPVSQTEFPGVQLQVERTGGRVVASWQPRQRFGTELNPIASSNFRGWSITVDDGAATTFLSAVPEFDIADTFGGSITVTVRPDNRVTGLGPALAEVA